jgi:hypothetical protein
LSLSFLLNLLFVLTISANYLEGMLLQFYSLSLCEFLPELLPHDEFLQIDEDILLEHVPFEGFLNLCSFLVFDLKEVVEFFI